LKRYRASGNTQKNGIAGTSRVKAVVTPSIRLEGTKARATHRARLFHDGGPAMSPVVTRSAATGRTDFDRQTRNAHRAIMAISAAYPKLQNRLCVLRRSRGSSKKG